MPAFLDRARELKLLKQVEKQRDASLIVIKGRRRIGKSRLVREFSDGKAYYRFVGLAPEPNITAQDQRDEFARLLHAYFPKLPSLKADNWAELFSILAENTKTQRCIIFFDEISWLAEGDHTFLPKLKNAWDYEFSSNNKMMLILCTSISLWIESNILSSTGFVGRIHQVITLKELSLKYSSEFLMINKPHLSSYDQFKFLSISGGVPSYLQSFNANLPVDENIKQLCYSSGGLLFREFDQIFHDLFGKRSTTYKAITNALVKGPLSTTDLLHKLEKAHGGSVSEYLLDLKEAGFLSRDYHWDLKAQTYTRNSRYRLSDNYLRFYLRYLAKHKKQIQEDRYTFKPISTLPEWSAVMGLQFENLVLNNRELIWQHLPINPADILIDGAYYQTTTKRQQGCQIDYMIQTKFNNLFIIEIKFLRGEVKLDIVDEVEQKIKRLAKPKSLSCFPVLIHVNGVTDAVLDSNYFTSVIDFADLIA